MVLPNIVPEYLSSTVTVPLEMEEKKKNAILLFDALRRIRIGVLHENVHLLTCIPDISNHQNVVLANLDVRGKIAYTERSSIESVWVRSNKMVGCW